MLIYIFVHLLILHSKETSKGFTVNTRRLNILKKYYFWDDSIVNQWGQVEPNFLGFPYKEITQQRQALRGWLKWGGDDVILGGKELVKQMMKVILCHVMV